MNKPEAIVILFPYVRCAWREEDMACMAQHYDFGPENLIRLLAEMTTIAQRLRQEIGKTYLVLWENDTELTARFGEHDGAIRISSEAMVDEVGGRWIKKPKFIHIVSQIKEQTILVAGFHYEDCVSKFIRAAKRTGKKVLLSPALTDLRYHAIQSEILGVEMPYELPEFIDPEEFERLRKEAIRRFREKHFPELSALP